MAGVTPSGFITRREPEIIAAKEQKAREIIHPNVNVRDDEFLGQSIAIQSAAEAEVWEVLQSLSDITDIDKAEGVYLDHLGALRYVFRQEASQAVYEEQRFVTEEGVSIPAGTAMTTTGGKSFFVTDDVFVTTSSCLGVKFIVNDVLDSTFYNIVINGTSYGYTSGTLTNAKEILNELRIVLSSAGFDAQTPTGETSLVINFTEPSSVSSTTFLLITEVIGRGSVTAVLSESVNITTNALNTVVPFIQGFIRTFNPTNIISGSDLQTDEEYRQAIKNRRASAEGGTIEAIRASLLAVTGVTSVSVIENDEGFEVEGRPPHSVECIVSGGTNEDVANNIRKAGGIKTWGNTLVPITTVDGQDRVIRFTRASDLNLAIRVSYTPNTEENLSEAISDTIKQVVVDYVSSLPAGVDFIPTRLLGDIYSNTTGLGLLTVEYEVIAASGDTPTGAWLTSILSVSDSAKATTATVDVIVQEV